MFSEAVIINKLKAYFPEHIGDDAAVIPGPHDTSYVVSKDLLLERVHFRPTYFSPQDLAHKALHVNLSDIAAMGAEPQFIMLGIAVPEVHSIYAEEFLESFATACKQSQVKIIGGDTTASAQDLMISITVFGQGSKRNLKYRSDAKVGDLICVAGNLGYAHLGLLALEQGILGFDDYKTALLRPIAKLSEGKYLSSLKQVSSMMDISDGLVVDLKRLCRASKVAALIKDEQIIFAISYLNACQNLKVNPTEAALVGGEDYGLLFTVDADFYRDLATKFQKDFGYNLQCLGQIVAGEGVNFSGTLDSKKLKLFSHFGEE